MSLQRSKAGFGALLRCGKPGHGEAAISTWLWPQIAMGSSSNATATRRFAGSSAANS
jgi:hypothetical protein